MSTVKQRRAARKYANNTLAAKPKTTGEILEEVGYARTVIINPQIVTESQGFKDELVKLGFDSDNARSVVAEVLNNADEAGIVRLAAAREVFKVNGDYAPDRHLNLNVDVELEQREREIANQLLHGQRTA